MYRHVLIPLDGSTLAEQALAEIPHVASPETRVTLLQIVRLPTPIITPEMSMPVQVLDIDQIKDDARAYLEAEAQTLAAQGIPASVEVIEGDDIVRSIAAYANQQDVDLIVMSTHGRGGISRLLFGSVTAALIRQVNCPVLIVRPQQAAR